MITQPFLNSEIDLANRIFIYYTDKILDYLEIGGKEYQQWYRDSLQIAYFKKALEAVYLIDDKIYLGSGEITIADFLNFGSKVREFINSDLRQIVYADDNTTDPDVIVINPPIIPSEPPIIVITGEVYYGWAYFEINITEDDPSTVALPFNISEADVNSLRVTVNDNNPDPLVGSGEEGCHIIGSTLYWHNYYNLKTGDKVFINFKRITA